MILKVKSVRSMTALLGKLGVAKDFTVKSPTSAPYAMYGFGLVKSKTIVENYLERLRARE